MRVLSFTPATGFYLRSEGENEAIPHYGHLAYQADSANGPIQTAWQRIEVNGQIFQAPELLGELDNPRVIFSVRPGTVIEAEVTTDPSKIPKAGDERKFSLGSNDVP